MRGGNLSNYLRTYRLSLEQQVPTKDIKDTGPTKGTGGDGAPFPPLFKPDTEASLCSASSGGVIHVDALIDAIEQIAAALKFLEVWVVFLGDFDGGPFPGGRFFSLFEVTICVYPPPPPISPDSNPCHFF